MTLVAEVRDLVPIKDNERARRRSITDVRCLDERYPIIESEGGRELPAGQHSAHQLAEAAPSSATIIVCTDIRLSGRPERAT